MKYYLLVLFFPLFLMSEERIADLGPLGKIVYHIRDGLCNKVVRLSELGEVRYEHIYHYDENNKIIAEDLIGNIGTINYSGNINDGYLIAKTPFGEEVWQEHEQCTSCDKKIDGVYDERGNLIQKGSVNYYYDGDKLSQVTSEKWTIFFKYDEYGRRIAKKTISSHDQNEEYYLFLDGSEIGSISESGEVKWLRIPGLTTHPDMVRAIAIETKDAVYAPIYDFRWNIVKLVNINDGTIIHTKSDPYGQNLRELSECPWIFSSKRFDAEIGLVNFGYRDYDPDLKEWISLDPLMQDQNPYRYCFDNPLQYFDPDGRFAMAVPILTWTGSAITFPVWGPSAVVVISGATISYLGYKAIKNYQHLQEKNDSYKKPKSGISNKEGAKDAPSWAKGKRPYKWESGKDFAKRLLDDEYGSGNYDTGPGSEFNKIKKWGDRSFE